MGNEKATIWFMDGEQALYYDERKPTTDNSREDVIEVLLRPSTSIIGKYGIPDDMLNIDVGEGQDKLAMWVQYPEELLHWITRGVAWPKLVVLCGFDGTKTDFMKRVDSKNMFFLIDNLKQEIFSLKMLIIKKDEEIKNIRIDVNEYARTLMDVDRLRGKEPGDYSDNPNGG
jgi:hypothetical protein